MLVEKIREKQKNVFYVKSFSDAVKLINNFNKNCVVMNIGAGDIYKLSELVVSK